MKKDCILWIITSIFHVKLKIPLGIIKLLIIVPYRTKYPSSLELVEIKHRTNGVLQRDQRHKVAVLDFK